MKKEQRYCCEKCGSSDIEVRAWVKPYENNRFSTYYEPSLAETESAYCCNCGEWVKLVEKEVEVKANDPWRCDECGSFNIEVKVWTDANTGHITDEDNIEDNDRWCRDCKTHSDHILESELMERIEEWWGAADFKTMECITGYCQTDFSPEEGYQAFVDACHEWWDGQTTDEKISVYFENK